MEGIPRVSSGCRRETCLNIDTPTLLDWVIWEQSNHTVVTLKVTTDGRPDTLINVAHDDGPHSCVLSDKQPIAWIVTRGNRWVVTKNAPTWEEYLASEGVII